MAKQTLKELQALAKKHKIKYYYEIPKDELVEILRQMGKEIYPTKNQNLGDVIMVG